MAECEETFVERKGTEKKAGGEREGMVIRQMRAQKD